MTYKAKEAINYVHEHLLFLRTIRTSRSGTCASESGGSLVVGGSSVCGYAIRDGI